MACTRRHWLKVAGRVISGIALGGRVMHDDTVIWQAAAPQRNSIYKALLEHGRVQRDLLLDASWGKVIETRRNSSSVQIAEATVTAFEDKGALVRQLGDRLSARLSGLGTTLGFREGFREQWFARGSREPGVLARNVFRLGFSPKRYVLFIYFANHWKLVNSEAAEVAVQSKLLVRTAKIPELAQLKLERGEGSSVFALRGIRFASPLGGTDFDRESHFRVFQRKRADYGATDWSEESVAILGLDGQRVDEGLSFKWWYRKDETGKTRGRLEMPILMFVFLDKRFAIPPTKVVVEKDDQGRKVKRVLEPNPHILNLRYPFHRETGEVHNLSRTVQTFEGLWRQHPTVQKAMAACFVGMPLIYHE